MSPPVIERREFLKLTMGASSGLLIGLYLPHGNETLAASPSAVFAPNVDGADDE